MREGEGWRAACKFKKLAFDCVWPQQKQSKSLFDGNTPTSPPPHPTPPQKKGEKQDVSLSACLFLS